MAFSSVGDHVIYKSIVHCYSYTEIVHGGGTVNPNVMRERVGPSYTHKSMMFLQAWILSIVS